MDKASKAFEEAIESMAKLAETVMKSTIGRAISKEEQIYEMALASCNPDFYKDKTCVECDYRRCCSLIYIAEKLYTAGYRKASDIAAEIFADFTKNKVCTNEEDWEVLNALKKKYIGDSKDGT